MGGVTQRRPRPAERPAGHRSVARAEQTLIVEPLDYACRPVGLAALSRGGREPRLVEQLSELLSVAVYTASL
jgi:hypothetical protein